jgi:HEAT repeat protein
MAQSKKPTAESAFDAQSLLSFLKEDELDYPGGAIKFGKAALPFLSQLVVGSDENLASKAAYLAGYIDDEGSADVLQTAAEKGSVVVRTAAAFGAQRMSSAKGQKILEKSLDDNDPSVIKFALKSASSLKVEKNLKSKIDRISKDFANSEVKSAALDMMKKMK